MTFDQMLEIAKKLSEQKNIIITGSVAMELQGARLRKDEEYHELDIRSDDDFSDFPESEEQHSDFEMEGEFPNGLPKTRKCYTFEGIKLDVFPVLTQDYKEITCLNGVTAWHTFKVVPIKSILAYKAQYALSKLPSSKKHIEDFITLTLTHCI